MELKYFLGLSSLGTLSEARVITGSCLRCSCSFGGVNAGVEEATEKTLALLRVVTPEVTPSTVMALLFLALAVRTT
ncbi:hypothetical protein ACFX2J_032836 [Malus domestica]